MSETVSIKIRIDGSSFKNVEVDAKDLNNAIKEIKGQVDTLNSSIINWAQAGQVVQSLSETINQITDAFRELSDAYQVQVEGEARLAQAMRNTMAATDDEIESIKELCSAQQQLGIIGDEVQLSGAQELATYLEKKSSLEKLIPVMNDMLAQQYGYEASCESAAQIASMLGKVMNGQTEALSRYGYKFDEAQKKVLQFGTESERAAVLAQVVSDSVGGMNAQMALTNSGKLKQVANALGDIKEQAGSIATKLMPVMQGLSNVATTALGVGKLVTAFKALKAAIDTSAAAARVFKISVGGVVALAATAVAAFISKINRQAEAAREAAQEEKDAMESIRSSVSDTAGDTIRLYREMQKAWLELGSSLSDKVKFIKDNKEQFHELGIEVSNVSDAENLFVKNEAAFIASVQNRAMAAAAMELASQKYQESVSKMLEAEQLRPNDRQNSAAHEYATSKYLEQLKGKTGRDRFDTISRQSQIYAQAYNEYIDSIREGIRQAAADIQKEGDRIFSIAEEASSKYRENMSNAGFSEAAEDTADAAGKASASVKTLADDIAAYRNSVQSAVEVENTFGRLHSEDTARLSAMHSGIEQLIRKYGLENKAVKELISEYRKLRDEKMGSILPESRPLPKTGAVTIGSKNEKNGNPVAELAKAGESADSVMQSLGVTMTALSNVVADSAAGWLKWGANVLQAVASSLPALHTLFAAHQAVAAAEAGSAVAATPVVGPMMAIAAIASILAAMAAIPAFASGGIAYGPTLGLFGEYAGASSNPEVVAPLDRLRSLIGVDDPSYGKVEFVIQGRTLRGIMNKMDRINNRVR